ncbi:MAG: hypothetical protein JKY38_16730, partial [Ralstonia sp.]|nr:hypothetical protein [Ralstonia sp.]
MRAGERLRRSTGDGGEDAPGVGACSDATRLERARWRWQRAIRRDQQCLETRVFQRDAGPRCRIHCHHPHALAVAPRNVLKRVLGLYHAKGWRPVVAPELEFYLTKPNIDPNEPIEPPVGRTGRRGAGASGAGGIAG